MKDIVKVLEEIIDQHIDEVDFPQVKGNSIRIKHMVIRKSRNGYLIYDTQDNKQVAKTFCKASAIALAKNLAKGLNVTEKVLQYDHIIEKNYMDSIFYKNTISKTTDEFKRDVIEIRFLDAKDRTESAKRSLDAFIFA